MAHQFSQQYRDRIRSIHQRLGIDESYERDYKLWLQEEATDLLSVGNDVFHREQFLAPDVAKRWAVMRKAAQRDFVEISLVSCFRSVEQQTNIIQRKLDQGQNIRDILKVSAAPGHSEHHTGRAIDIGTSGCDHLTEAFEETMAFQWLSIHAERYGFTLSYPRNNTSGVSYEPWHWACSV